MHYVPDLILRLKVHAINTITMMSSTNIATDIPIRIGRFFSSNQSTDVCEPDCTTVMTDLVVSVVVTAVDTIGGSVVVFVTILGVVWTPLSPNK